MSFSFYAHNDNQLNSIYRQLSRSSQSTPLFWPKCYYSWFFTEEKTLYNILLLRQKLGPKIEDAEVKEYNAIRSQTSPHSPYTFSKVHRRGKDNNNNSLAYDDVTWRRKNIKRILVGSFVLGVTGVLFFRLSRLWLFGGFFPFAITVWADRKYIPYTEIENFYKYVYERRKANSLYQQNSTGVQKELEGVDKKLYSQINSDLQKANKTLYEASNGLNSLYINSLN